MTQRGLYIYASSSYNNNNNNYIFIFTSRPFHKNCESRKTRLCDARCFFFLFIKFFFEGFWTKVNKVSVDFNSASRDNEGPMEEPGDCRAYISSDSSKVEVCAKNVSTFDPAGLSSLSGRRQVGWESPDDGGAPLLRRRKPPVALLPSPPYSHDSGGREGEVQKKWKKR